MTVSKQNVDSSTAKNGPKAVKSAYGAYFVDLLDIYLPVLVLPPALIYFIHPSLTAQQTAAVTAAVFVASLIGRPLGAIVFGPLADRIGKTKVATLAMLMSGLATVVMGLLPGFATIGWASIVIFVTLRLLNGIFIGGQYSSALPLAMEASPKNKRGLYGGVINSAFPAAYVAIAFVVMLLTSTMEVGSLDSSYVVWGWRIPFVATGLLELGITVYYLFQVSDAVDVSDTTAARPHGALRMLLMGKDRSRLLQVFVLMNGMWLAQQAVSAVAPGLMATIPGGSPALVSLALMVAFGIGVPTNIMTGILSQKLGRRRMLIILSILTATVGSLAYGAIVSASSFGLSVYVCIAVVVVLTVAPFALVPSYISERFPSSIRASGYGISYSMALVLPSFYAVYQAGLAALMPFEFTPVALVVIGSLVLLIGALAGPETKDVAIED